MIPGKQDLVAVGGKSFELANGKITMGTCACGCSCGSCGGNQ
jgi:hydroxyethylthiazole kinase-like sugar kinase family protein